MIVILQGTAKISSRRLLSVVNGTSHGPEWEQCDYELTTAPRLWVVSHVLCILFLFLGNFNEIFHNIFT